MSSNKWCILFWHQNIQKSLQQLKNPVIFKISSFPCKVSHLNDTMLYHHSPTHMHTHKHMCARAHTLSRFDKLCLTISYQPFLQVWSKNMSDFQENTYPFLWQTYFLSCVYHLICWTRCLEPHVTPDLIFFPYFLSVPLSPTPVLFIQQPTELKALSHVPSLVI